MDNIHEITNNHYVLKILTNSLVDVGLQVNQALPTVEDKETGNENPS